MDGGMMMNKEDCPFKSMMKGKHEMGERWGHKNIGEMVLFKTLCGIFGLVFLYLAAFAIRKGWNKAGKK